MGYKYGMKAIFTLKRDHICGSTYVGGTYQTFFPSIFTFIQKMNEYDVEKKQVLFFYDKMSYFEDG